MKLVGEMTVCHENKVELRQQQQFQQFRLEYSCRGKQDV